VIKLLLIYLLLLTLPNSSSSFTIHHALLLDRVAIGGGRVRVGTYALLSLILLHLLVLLAFLPLVLLGGRSIGLDGVELRK
jgi:hypothetical protein